MNEGTGLKGGIDRATCRNVCIFLALLALALMTRASRIGDPAIDVDEQFYLLVADRMWHGALPYVDIWDRKPILLFLIYAALRPLSPNGIIAYQIGALLFATSTAFVIVLIARRFANLAGAFLAGAAYLVYLPVLDGGGGQSPVFYNLFMAIGALEVIKASEADDEAGIWRHGLRSMLWAGIAIQVKYTAAIEGIAYGLWLIYLLWRNGVALSVIVRRAALWTLAAIAPTLIATGVYFGIGHGAAFLQANFLSIFEKLEPTGYTSRSLRWSAFKLGPLLLVTIPSIFLLLRRGAAGSPKAFLLFWTAFAIADFFMMGNYYDHYALPFVMSAVIICAVLLETPGGGIAGMAVMGCFAILCSRLSPADVRELDQARVAAMVAEAQPYAARGCIYLNSGPPVVYLLTRSCLPTRYVFPGHLNDADEAAATNATRSMAKLLATRPAAVFVADKQIGQPRNRVTAAMLNSALATDYKRVAVLADVEWKRHEILYARKDLVSAVTPP